MNALHSTTTAAVTPARAGAAHQPRTRTVTRTSETSGAANGRGYVRGTGRTHPTTHPTTHQGAAARQWPAHIAPVADGADGVTAPEGAASERVPAQRTAAQAAEAEAAFTAYVQERRASLYATAYHLTGDRFAAEDLLQSALFSTYRAWDRISDKAAVGGYLRRTMTNLHISAWRRRKLSEYPTEELPETVGDTDEMGGTELRAVLWQALARLPEQQRTMLVLRYYEGRTDPEIAEILGISVGTVKSSIWRSLRRLRDDQALSFGRDQEDAFGELVA
ncbi:SigE family RNA polymerase sigma factor [Actinacidiphila acididurans]|uniref:SigE family RNA polymerase sigma factor n=1 Tax=Actinacidiphila acididurans TaxID=2784346 RepID=A0ABS2TP71_9ACTN|nr:SigE family RNA polymerase sigma factor [Actinacidiphila acididurans]MBM9504622.1 SigE family RNA polymerase sigma factor [Actinacidiphila acididurans]